MCSTEIQIPIERFFFLFLFFNKMHRNIGSTLCAHRVPLSCLHRQQRRHGIADWHRVNIVPTSYILFTLSTTSQCWPTSCQSTLCAFFPVYIVVIVDITMLTNIKQTLCIHRVPSFMFISSTLPTLQCWSASCRHRVYIVPPISGLHRWHCRHRDVDSWPTSSRHCGHIVCLITLLRLFCTVAIKTL